MSEWIKNIKGLVNSAALCFAAFGLLSVGAMTFSADEPPDESKQNSEEAEQRARKERYTKWMKSYADETKVVLAKKKDENEQLAELVPNAVFRYSDELRFIPDATLWVWTHDHRPVAFQKVEGNNHGGGQMWTICFASLSEELISVRWPTRRTFTATKPGVTFQQIPMSDAPASNLRGRSVQLKALKERFSARLNVDKEGKHGDETRTMAKPLFEYSDPVSKLPLGAIFGMSATGTNPDLLLLIEARNDSEGKPRWECAYARMTSNSLRIRLDDAEIWTEEDAQSAAYENWIYYFMRRDFK